MFRLSVHGILWPISEREGSSVSTRGSPLRPRSQLTVSLALRGKIVAISQTTFSSGLVAI